MVEGHGVPTLMIRVLGLGTHDACMACAPGKTRSGRVSEEVPSGCA